jgi:L-asparaginase
MTNQKPRVTLLCTGGTISMRFDPATGGAVPALTGQALLALVPDVAELADIEVVDFSLLPGPHMTPPRMLELAHVIRSHLQTQDGVVVTHGTDTLEECAYLAELVLDSPKPVVFVGAMRNSSEASWDGPQHLRSAIRVALTREARDLGVLVVMNDLVLSARDATKTHTEAADTFQGRDFGPLGVVDKDRVLVVRRPIRVAGEFANLTSLEQQVEIVKLSAGSDGRVLDFLVQSGCRGVVLEGLGRGNAPLPAVESIRRASNVGIPLVLTSRCPRGRVLDTYAYAGGGRLLREMGVVLGGFLPSHKARLRLMALLGTGRSLPEIRASFESTL